jgi:hypothetical protein
MRHVSLQDYVIIFLLVAARNSKIQTLKLVTEIRTAGWLESELDGGAIASETHKRNIKRNIGRRPRRNSIIQKYVADLISILRFV